MSRAESQSTATKRVPPKPAGAMSDEAVAARTGKTWGEWFAILDDAGASQMENREILELLGQHDVGPVWRQMVMAGYQRRLGAKANAAAKSAPAGSRVANISRTVSATLLAAYGAWERPTRRKRFLKDEITFATRRDGKTLRFGWKPDASRVSIVFKPLSKTRTQVTIEHDKLKTAADVERMQVFWTEALDRMQALVEKCED